MKKILTLLLLLVSVVFIFIFKTDKKEQKAPYLSVVGFCRMADGLGRQCPDLIEALCDEFSIGFYPQTKSILEDVPDKIINIIKNPNPKLGKVVFYNDSLWRPKKHGKSYGALNIFSTKKDKDQLRICYSMLESTRIPQQWVDILNQYFDIACVPDPFLEQVYKDSGVTIPVFTLPLGLKLKPFLDQPIKKAYHDVFRFGCMGFLSDRKNQKKLILAFDKAFKKDPKVELVIHARRSEGSYQKEVEDVLKKLHNPQIIFQKQCLSSQSYLQFFKTLDMLVNVSKGEGFSIQPREALALGIPVLLSNNTAQKSIINNVHAQSLESKIQQPCFYKNLHLISGDNFDFEIDDLAYALKQAYENRASFLEKGEENKAYAALFDYTQLNHLYKNIINPKQCIIGPKNQILDDGIMTDSQELKEKYERLKGLDL